MARAVSLTIVVTWLILVVEISPGIGGLLSGRDGLVDYAIVGAGGGYRVGAAAGLGIG